MTEGGGEGTPSDSPSGSVLRDPDLAIPLRSGVENEEDKAP
jgi:hypothetical protein